MSLPIHLRHTPKNHKRGTETYDHPFILEHFASWIKPNNYLELGVRGGHSFNRVIPFCKKAYGVDMKIDKHQIQNKASNVKYFEMTTDTFFTQIKNSPIQFDMVFIDADHSKEQVYKDFVNVSKHIIEDGFVFLHDTYPYCEQFADPNLCNDAWAGMLRIKQEFYENWEYITLPFNPGLTIMKKMPIKQQLQWKK